MYKFLSTPLKTHRGIRLSVSDDGLPLSYQQFFQRLAVPSFALQFSQQIASLPYRAVFWELPALNADGQNAAFESVLLAAPALRGLSPNKRPFRRWLHHIPHDQSTHFPNLSSSAELISPQGGPADAFSHLKAFCEHASKPQLQHFWATVSQRVLANIEARPIWVSTSGLGVAWLHLRLDSAPKYYRYSPYQAGSARSSGLPEKVFS